MYNQNQMIPNKGLFSGITLNLDFNGVGPILWDEATREVYYQKTD